MCWIIGMEGNHFGGSVEEKTWGPQANPQEKTIIEWGCAREGGGKNGQNGKKQPKINIMTEV